MNKSGVMRLYLCMALCAGSALAGGKHELPLQQAPSAEAARLNPYSGQWQAARAGQKLYRRECSACHGSEAQGAPRGPALISPALSHALPGTIFWVLRNGSLRAGMPSFSHLPEAQRWQIITYLKTLH
jgi:mono/diheme cytochrome c family protein